MTVILKRQSLAACAILIAGVLMLAPLSLALAHAGEEHETKAEEVAHEAKTAREMSMGEMEQMISLLRQLIALIVEQKRVAALPAVAAPAAKADAEMELHHDEHAKDSDDDHADEDAHDDDAAEAAEKKLVIEVEAHFGKTHVHVRYVDKPESMFFVEAALTDEAALVAAIAAKTGFTSDEVKAALKYL